MKKETTPRKNNNLIIIIILATIFGLGAGITSTFITKPYILKEVYNIPFSGDMNFSGDKLHQANLIIENAKNITIEQDKKVNETISSAQESLVGIFKEKEKDAIPEVEEDVVEKEFDLEKTYKPNEKIAEGIIITSDGWILINNFIEEIKEISLKTNFVAITKDKKIYKLDNKQIIETGDPSYIFIRLKDASELPVKSFASKNSLMNGQVVVATNWEREGFLTYVLNKNPEKKIILSSDEISGSFLLTDDLKKYFDNAFIFNLNGEIIGLLHKESGIIAMDFFQAKVQGLLEGIMLQPSLGINYVNLSRVIPVDGKPEKGALIYSDQTTEGIKKESAAEIAGLKIGDTITSINNIEINENNDIAEIIQKYLVGDKIDIIFLRKGEVRTTKAILKKLDSKK